MRNVSGGLADFTLQPRNQALQFLRLEHAFEHGLLHALPRGEQHLGHPAARRVAVPGLAAVRFTNNGNDQSQCLDGHSVPGLSSSWASSTPTRRSLNALTVIRSRDGSSNEQKTRDRARVSMPWRSFGPGTKVNTVCRPTRSFQSQCLDGHSVPGLSGTMATLPSSKKVSMP